MDRRAFISTLTALMCGSGCARPDWIEQTLVTVDVTGTWQGRAQGLQYSPSYELKLEQRGPKVGGAVRESGRASTWSAEGDNSGPIEGTVAGDAFSFRQTNGSFKGEMTVSGDEMTGWVLPFNRKLAITLRRVNSSSQPDPQRPKD